MFKNILLGVDGSEHALNAAKLAGDLARLTGADIWVIVCFEPVPAYIGVPFYQQMLTKNLEKADQILIPALEAVGPIQGSINTEKLEGETAEAILNVSKIQDIDLIVMGTRGLGSFASMMIGSKSQKVVANASCPVLLVR
jgi:nucleotide-binding universal stress UspA family protein